MRARQPFNFGSSLGTIGLAWVGPARAARPESACELTPETDGEVVVAGDAKRGEDIFWKHPVAACVNCHMIGGKGSAVGPALDGIAKTKDAAYLIESLAEPNARLAESYKATPISPMPPMRLILKPQEFEDVMAFLKTLK